MFRFKLSKKGSRKQKLIRKFKGKSYKIQNVPDKIFLVIILKKCKNLIEIAPKIILIVSFTGVFEIYSFTSLKYAKN